MHVKDFRRSPSNRQYANHAALHLHGDPILYPVLTDRITKVFRLVQFVEGPMSMGLVVFEASLDPAYETASLSYVLILTVREEI